MSDLVERAPVLRELSAEEQAAKRAMLAELEQDRVRLLARQPFLATLAMRMDLKPVIDARLPTAATDGQHLYFSVPFMAGLDEAERLFVMAHEVWHCAALHFLRRGQRSPARWNLAIDHEVNSLLVEQGMSLPRGAVLFRHITGLNAEEVYERLPEDEQRLPERGRLADDHDPDPDPNPDTDGSAQCGQGVPVDPDYQPGGHPDIWREWPRRVHAAAQQVYRQAGSQPGWLKRLLKLHGQASLPWQAILRRFVDRVRSDRFQWTPPNRRYVGQGLWLPGRGGERLSIAVAIDTSGSTMDDLPRFLTELGAIMKSYGRFQVRLIACDTRVHFDELFSDEQPMPAELPLGGGGGTCLTPVFTLLRRDTPRALVFLTDGYADVPEQAPPFPVLWCLTADGQRPCPWGQTLRLPANARRGLRYG